MKKKVILIIFTILITLVGIAGVVLVKLDNEVSANIAQVRANADTIKSLNQQLIENDNKIKANTAAIKEGCGKLSSKIKALSTDYATKLQESQDMGIDDADQNSKIVDRVVSNIRDWVTICAMYTNQQSIDDAGWVAPQLESADSAEEIIKLLKLLLVKLEVS